MDDGIKIGLFDVDRPDATDPLIVVDRNGQRVSGVTFRLDGAVSLSGASEDDGLVRDMDRRAAAFHEARSIRCDRKNIP